jgi:hypothetical protein
MPAFSKARLSGPVVAVKGSLRRASPALDRAHRTLLSSPNQPTRFSKEAQFPKLAWRAVAQRFVRMDAVVMLEPRIELVQHTGRIGLRADPGVLSGGLISKRKPKHEPH